MCRIPAFPPRKATRASRRQPLRALLLLALAGQVKTAAAEGSAEWGSQPLLLDTVMYVDILDHTVESIRWTGAGGMRVLDSNGTQVAQLSNGDSTALPASGTYNVVADAEQYGQWSVEVVGQTDPGHGRLWSENWHFSTGSYATEAAFNGSVYAYIDLGVGNTVIEMQALGLSGFDWSLAANGVGIAGANARSVPSSGASFTPDYPIYVNPPTIASYVIPTPTVSQAAFVGDGGLLCNQIAPGYSLGAFELVTSVDGVAHVVCDLNADGSYDTTSDADVHLQVSVTTGTNSIAWDGTDNVGNNVAPGSYSCRALITVGEFHYVARDVETSYEGFRLFLLDSAGTRTGLDMFWNDAAVQSSDVSMPNGQLGLETSGASGMNAGTYPGTTSPNVNARSWGAFSSTSKGNNAYLDTYTFANSVWSDPFAMEVVDGTLDDDADLLTNIEETCEVATDPTDFDSDDDTLGDGFEVITSTTNPLSADTDEGGVDDGTEVNGGYNPLDSSDDDNDGDGLPNGDEDGVGTDPSNPDTDGDGISDGDEVFTTGTNPLDDDSDDDGLLDGNEDVDADGVVDPGETGANNGDSDGDGLQDGTESGLSTPQGEDTDGGIFVADGDPSTTTNPADDDSDDDGLLDGSEDSNHDGWNDGAETAPDLSDSDGVQDGTESGINVPQGNDTQVELFVPDSDPSTTTDPLDDDTDNDGLLDGTEDVDYDGFAGGGETDATQFDTDGDGLGDGLEGGLTTPQGQDTDSGVFVADADPSTITDPTDDDSDDDGLLDGSEDSDSDGARAPSETDPGNVDSDNDGLQDGTESGQVSPQGNGTDGGIFVVDTDPSSTTNPVDDDSDDDGLLDGVEDGDHDGLVAPWEADPNAFDTDADGIGDGVEAGLTAPQGSGTDGTIFQADADPSVLTNPADDDTDDDGLLDGTEDADQDGAFGNLETDPTVFDTDGDGLGDGQELGLTAGEGADTGESFLPDADPTTTTNPLDIDSDDDRLGDGEEDVDGDGAVADSETDPNNPDTDGDRLLDGDEVLDYGTNPLDLDTDDGGVADGDEVETYNINPLDGSDDAPYLDPDGDGLLTGEEETLGTDPNVADTDGDGLSDGDEVNTTTTDPVVADTDGDGLDDGTEVNDTGTDPLNPDTDGGGVTDGEEVNNGTDPLKGDDDISKGYYSGGCSVAPTGQPLALTLALGAAALLRRRRR